MKAQEYREMSDEELSHSIDDLYQELLNLRFQLATRQATDSSRIKVVRRDIARAKTVLRERELQVQAEVQ